MTPDEFDAALEAADEIVQQHYEAFSPARREKLRQTMTRMLPPDSPHLMASVQVFVRIADRTQQKVITLARTDVSLTDDEKLFAMGFGPTPRTFLVDGQLVTVPEDQCPKCLSEWTISLSKLKPCSTCGLELIRDAKVVAVENVCPLCEEEVDFMSTAVCNYCGFDIEADYAARVS